MNVSAASSGFPVLAKYELLEEIGHGGMATVYRARDPRLGREVAVKVIHKHLRENPEVRRRFVSEARAVAKLRHRGIVEVYDVAAEDDVERYLVVELVRGTTLREVLRARGTLPPEVAAAIGIRLCEAVEHAHECSVIHRDIKPENVLIETIEPEPSERLSSDPTLAEAEQAESDPPSDDPASGRPEGPLRSGSRDGPRIKLTDFGIAKTLDTKGVTSTGQILGSPAHMAPEQIEGGDVGRHTDVFALGVLLYECMVGHLPFEGKNPAQVLRHVLDGTYEPADHEQPRVGGRWGGILARALEREPEDRLQTAAELAELLQQELADLGLEDAAEQIRAYFADPDRYEDDHAELLVPRLLERGEQARRQGRAPEAAADFNRALAYRPSDLVILKRVSALASRGLWRRRTARLAAILLGSVLLGAAAYGVTRWTRAPAGTREVQRAFTDRQRPPVFQTAPPAQPPTAVVVSTGRPALRPLIRRHLASAKPAATSPATRRVSFSLIPKGAQLTVDGQDRGSPFGQIFELEPGLHPVRVTVPAGSKCCKPKETTVTVTPPPEADPAAVQTIVLQLDRRPSTVTLVGGPSDGHFACPSLGLSGSNGVPTTVTLPVVEWTGFCEFSPGGHKATVVLRAGQSNSVPWPEG